MSDTPAIIDQRLDAAVLGLGDHSVACFCLAITMGPDGFTVHTEGHGAGLLLRQAVRDWLAAADAQTLEEHMAGADEPTEAGPAPAEGDDDDGPGDGGSPVLSPS